MRNATAAAFVAMLVAATSGPGMARGDAGAGAMARIEAKWGAVMRDIKQWDGNAFRQFREGYRDSPPAVLERALAAETFDEMMAAFAPHGAIKSRGVDARAMALGDIRPGDSTDPRRVAIQALATKALGDSARDLVFVPVAPCTVWDTRYAAGPPFAGAIADGVSRSFYSHWTGSGTDFSEYGGNPACAEANEAFIGARPFAVMMTVYVSDATANGWLTFYRDGDTDPSLATISVYYAPGPTRTQTVIAKSSRGYGTGTYDVAVTGRYGTVHAAASVTGYFLKPQATAFDCVMVEQAGSGSVADGADVSIALPAACPAGYARVTTDCVSIVGGRNVPLQSNNLLYSGGFGAACRWYNASGSAVAGSDYFTQSVCCRVPGR